MYVFVADGDWTEIAWDWNIFMQLCILSGWVGGQPHLTGAFSMNFNDTVLGLKANLRNCVRHKLLIKYKLNNDRIII
jgi:hypothetical protein